MPTTAPQMPRATKANERIGHSKMRYMNMICEQNHMIKFSFWRGFASVFGGYEGHINDLRNRFYHRHDNACIRRDWITVGNDLKNAFEDYKEKTEKK